MTAVVDVMSTELVTVTPSTTVAEAATVMGTRKVGSALVLEEGALVGIFTERDILRAVASDFDAEHHHVDAFMTRDPVTIAPGVEAGKGLLEIMLTQGFRHLPVVDDRGAVLGMISMRDLSRVL